MALAELIYARSPFDLGLWGLAAGAVAPGLADGRIGAGAMWSLPSSARASHQAGAGVDWLRVCSTPSKGLSRLRSPSLATPRRLCSSFGAKEILWIHSRIRQSSSWNYPIAQPLTTV